MTEPRETLFHRDFTIMVIGQIISLFGNNLLRFALSVYTLRLTGSATLFGTVMALAMIPTIFLTPLGGILADRASRKRIMVALDFFAAGLSAVSLLFLGGDYAVAAIIVVLVLLNIIQAFYSPTVQSSVPMLHAGDNIVRGNAVVNQVQALAALLGPVLGGILASAFGILPVVGVCAVCFFLSAVMELFLHIPFTRRAGGRVGEIIRQDLGASLRFMRRDQPDILRVIGVVALFNLVFSPLVSVGVSVMIINILGLSDALYGLSLGLMAAGSILGAAASSLLAGRLSTARLSTLLMLCGICLLPAGAAFLLGLGTMAVYVTITVCCIAAAALSAVFSIFTLSLVQQRTPPTLQGQVMGYILALSQCMVPLGQLAYGVLFDVFHSRVYILLFGVALVSVLVALGSAKTFKNMHERAQDTPVSVDLPGVEEA